MMLTLTFFIAIVLSILAIVVGFIADEILYELRKLNHLFESENSDEEA